MFEKKEKEINSISRFNRYTMRGQHHEVKRALEKKKTLKS